MDFPPALLAVNHSFTWMTLPHYRLVPQLAPSHLTSATILITFYFGVIKTAYTSIWLRQHSWFSIHTTSRSTATQQSRQMVIQLLMLTNVPSWVLFLTITSSTLTTFTWNRKHIRTLLKALAFFKMSTLISLYFAFVHSPLTYCTASWGNTYRTRLIPMQNLQYQAINIITFSPYRTNVSSLQNLAHCHKSGEIQPPCLPLHICKQPKFI